MRVAVVGTGRPAAEWSVRFLARGWDVVVADPAVPGLAAGLWPQSQLIGHFPGASLARLSTGSVGGCDVVHAVGGSVVGTSPLHVLPLAEIVGLDPASDEYAAKAALVREIGMVPVAVRASTAHLLPVERIAALREAVVDPDDAELAIEHGPALQVLAGGDPGALAAAMRAMRAFGRGPGVLFADWEARRFAAGARRWAQGMVIDTPLALYRCLVEPDWVDYNGHMTEAAYLTAFGWASDALFRFVGDDEAYRAAGHSFYTVETHINYLQECSVNEPLRFTTHVLGVDRKRLWFHHSMYRDSTPADSAPADGTDAHGGPAADAVLLATTEQMLVHVDMNAGRSAPILPEVREALDAIAAAHATVPAPATAGCLAITSR